MPQVLQPEGLQVVHDDDDDEGDGGGGVMVRMVKIIMNPSFILQKPTIDVYSMCQHVSQESSCRQNENFFTGNKSYLQ